MSAEKQEAKRTPTIVTSETLSEFIGKHTEPKPEPQEVREPPKEEKTAKVEAKTEAKEEPPKEKKNPVQPRISGLVQERNREREEKRAAQERADRLERELAELRSKQKPEADPDPEPKPDEFKDALEYARALSEWKAERAVKSVLEERDKKASEDKAKQEQAELVSAWQKRQDEFREQHDDYDDIVESSDLKIRGDVQQAVIESELGPALVYHFAQNPDVLKKLNGLSHTQALRELGKIEDRITAQSGAKSDAPAEAKNGSAPVAKTVEKTQAPEPIDPIKGDNAPVDKPREKMSFAEWKAQRKAGRIH